MHTESCEAFRDIWITFKSFCLWHLGFKPLPHGLLGFCSLGGIGGIWLALWPCLHSLLTCYLGDLGNITLLWISEVFFLINITGAIIFACLIYLRGLLGRTIQIRYREALCKKNEVLNKCKRFSKETILYCLWACYLIGSPENSALFSHIKRFVVSSQNCTVCYHYLNSCLLDFKKKKPKGQILRKNGMSRYIASVFRVHNNISIGLRKLGRLKVFFYY